MTALYEIAAAYRADAERLAELDLDPQTLADTLESMSGQLEVKAQNVAFVARNIEALAASIKEAESAMATRRKALENRAASLRAYLLRNMQLAGVQKIEGPYLRMSIKSNPAAVDVFDAAQIPADYMRQPEPPPPAPDKTAIKEALKSGVDVPGARLTQSQRLDIA